MSFNDIRTTLQALIAIYDNCNSLHTNAFDEAITTPTEDSVRRAMAIQLIINREWGLAKNENPSQGAFIIEELTELVEEAVLAEFQNIADRGGVLGAMETGYQRGKIQEESLYYEHKKHDGSYPIIGVNTFLNPKGMAQQEIELARSTEEEKQSQIKRLRDFQARNADKAPAMLEKLKQTVIVENRVGAGGALAATLAGLAVVTVGVGLWSGQHFSPRRIPSRWVWGALVLAVFAALNLFIAGQPWGEYPVVAQAEVPVAGIIGRLWDDIRLFFQ